MFIFFILIASPWNKIPIIGNYLSEYFYLPSLFVQNFIIKINDVPRWTHTPTGSGDTMDDWILLFTWVGVALAGCIAWSLLDRKRNNYILLNYWLKVGIRYYVAIVVFSYGISKIFALQMPSPSITQMYTELGDYSPMGLTWLFVGYSVPYQVFGGIMEAFAAILLSIRRTQLLGSLLMLGTLANVVMLNFSYDIPVKLFSSELLLLTLYLVTNEQKRLLDFFVRNTEVKPSEREVMFDTKRQNVVRWSLLALFWVGGLGYNLYNYYSHWQSSRKSESFALTGAYEVKEFKVNHSNPFVSDSVRWNLVVMDGEYATNYGNGFIRSGRSKQNQVYYSVDSLDHFTITFWKNPSANFEGKINILSPDELTLTGVSANDSLYIHLQKIVKEFKLSKRPFHWVSATPY